MTIDAFFRQYKTTVLLYKQLDIQNESIDSAIKHIALEYDNGKIGSAEAHLIELTDKLIEILES